jgi:hypothetical protein
VRENRFIDSAVGVSLVGQIQQIQVVGNSFSNFQLCGVQLERPIPDTRDVLIANNTFMDGTSAIRLWGPRVAGANIRISNNLILGRRAPDMFAYKARSTNAADGPGDGEAVSKVWSFGHNWREAVKPSGENAKGWIPPSAKDVVMEKIDGLDRDPKSPTFLRPAKDSPLATQGAGNEDPSLPRYVGALPPAGESAWDWERGWRMPPDAQLLTVSKEAKDGGKYRTISAALDDVKPWATIRVLDDAKYTEELLINRPNIHNHLMIESIKGAKLEITGVQNVLIQVLSIHGLTIRGFHLIADHTANSTLIFLQGKCSDILLERLTFRPGQIPGQFNGVEINDLSAGGRSPRVVVRHCTFVRAGTAVNLIGVKSDYSIPTPVHHIAIVDNRFSECGWGVVAKGAVSDVCVAGNQFLFCLRAATQVERLLDDVHDVVFANNTSIGSPVFFRVWDDRVRTGDVRVVANLSLETTYPDYLALDNGGTPDKLRALGDGAPFAKAWVFSRNWREVKLSEKSGAKPDGWIAPSSTDHRLDQITGVDRDRQTANYLHPAKDSPLSNQGAGREDPALPQYVGALPPEGVEPWDWDRSWRWNSRGALAAE